MFLLLFLYFYGWNRERVFNVPQVYQVQLISLPELQAAPPEEKVPEVDVETIPPPPEEKKKLKPKPKEAQPKNKQQTEQKFVQQKALDQTMGLSSDELFEFPWYLRLMTDKISRNWRNPYQGEEDTVLCTIYFRIQRDGTVTAASVEKSSGISSFDRAALRAVIGSSPLPPLPPDYGEFRLTVHLDFEYRKK
ncbi:MAG TPA: TonB family protein [Candidatus Glassbacteria bacterium]|nr:TonB family protein [Candidatus Glassbacteria bacterium]